MRKRKRIIRRGYPFRRLRLNQALLWYANRKSTNIQWTSIDTAVFLQAINTIRDVADGIIALATSWADFWRYYPDTSTMSGSSGNTGRSSRSGDNRKRNVACSVLLTSVEMPITLHGRHGRQHRISNKSEEGANNELGQGCYHG